MIEFLEKIWESTGLHQFQLDSSLLIKTLIMYVIIGVLVYLAIVKGFEPLLLLPIAFGMLLANIQGANLFHSDFPQFPHAFPHSFSILLPYFLSRRSYKSNPLSTSCCLVPKGT